VNRLTLLALITLAGVIATEIAAADSSISLYSAAHEQCSSNDWNQQQRCERKLLDCQISASDDDSKFKACVTSVVSERKNDEVPNYRTGFIITEAKQALETCKVAVQAHYASVKRMNRASTQAISDHSIWSLQERISYSSCANFVLGIYEGSRDHALALCTRDPTCDRSPDGWINKYSLFCPKQEPPRIELVVNFVNFLERRPDLIAADNPPLAVMLSLMDRFPCSRIQADP